MVSEYQDRNSLWHDKKCIKGVPSSNNGWIYSAYAKYLAPCTSDRLKLLAVHKKCVESYSPLRINRLPGKIHPPLSKDEVIGMASLGLVSNSELESNHYNFCNLNATFERKLSIPSIIRAVRALYKIKDEHRNYVWENQVVDAYPLAFKLGPEDVYYIRKYYKKSPGIFNTIVFYLNALQTYFKGNKSARMMLWLKLEDLNSSLVRFIPKKKWVKTYFGEEHDFYKNLEGRSK